jgi:hypothetical protein
MSYIDRLPVNDEGPYAITCSTPFANNCLLSHRSYTATLLCAFFLSSHQPDTCYCVFLYPVKLTLTQWLNLSMSGQDARLSRCTLPVLEQCVHDLCNATNRDLTRHFFRSKHALASKIGDIFRWCLRGMLSSLTPRARHFCLPFIRDGSFSSFTMQDLHAHMTTAFGEPVLLSLTDVSYNTKAVQMARCGPGFNKPVNVRIHRSSSPTSPPGPIKRKGLKELNQIEPAIDNWPEQVSGDVKMKCMRDYLRNTTWQKPAVCAVCGRDKYGVPFVM